MSQTRSARVIMTTLVLVALNLRPVLTSVPVVLGDIEAATGWSEATLGLLTTLPVLCMGLLTLVVATIAERFGRRRTVAAALAVLTLALAIRWWADVPVVLWTSVVLAGVGIALALGLVPSIVREQLPSLIGRATGGWTAAMMTGAAVASALTVPLAQALGSWTKALAAWAVVAAVALIVWVKVEGIRHDDTRTAKAIRIAHLPWRNRTAWSLTAYVMVNSFVYYVLVAWIAPASVDRGLSAETAGWLLGVFSFAQIFSALFLTPIVNRLPSRRTGYTVILLGMCVTTLAIGLVPASSIALLFLLGALCGVFVSANYTVGIALLSEYGGNALGAARLSAMVLGCTYIVAAFGPWMAGAFLEVSGAYTWLFGIAAVIGLVQLVTIPALRRGLTIS